MHAFESNLAFVRACLAELEDYERAGGLFWTLSSQPPAGCPPFPQMTIGNIVLALDEMQAVEAGLSASERTALLRARTEWENRWMTRSVRLESKAAQELASRIGQWRAYVTDALEGDDLSDYSTSMRPRLSAARLLELLGPRHTTWAGSVAELELLDRTLDPQVEDGSCVLGGEMAAVYPPSPPYRFLYRRPRARNQ